MDVDFARPSIGVDENNPKVPDFSKLPSMKYQTDELTLAKPAKSNPSIMFGKRSELEDSSNYVGLFCPGYDKPVVITFPGSNISAQKFVYSKEKHVIRGEGEVVLLDRTGITKGTII
jgi:hypothetical protein